MALDESLKQLIGDVIRFDTTSDRSNLDLIQFIINELKETQCDITLDYNDSKTKANLLATIGPTEKTGGIVFAGHLDTVPVVGQNWHSPPYQLSQENGRLYGRGTSDMKGFCTLALAEFKKIALHHADKMTKPLYLMLTYDEEVGCLGAQQLVKKISDKINQPDLVLVGEPTNLKPVIAHKGIHCFDVQITGHGCHSSKPHLGINAITHGMDFIKSLDSIANELKHSGLQDTRFDPPYTTMNIGTINGGNAINVVADKCHIGFEMRPIPGEDTQTLINQFIESKNTILASAQKANEHQDFSLNITLQETTKSNPFNGNTNHAGTKFLLSILDDKEFGVVPFNTEAGTYQQNGWNTIVCGPGSIDQAHQPDEFIAIDQLIKGAEMLSRLSQYCLQ